MSRVEAKRHQDCTEKLPNMPHKISRSVLTFVITSAALLAAGGASAQVGTAALSPSDFTIYFEAFDGSRWVKMTTVQQQYFFNRARCLCDQDPSGELKIVVQPAPGAAQKIQALLQANLTGGQGVGYLFAGAQGYDCLSPNSLIGGVGLGVVCTNLLDPGNYPGKAFSMAVFENVDFWVSDPIPVAYLYNSLDTPSCGSKGTCDSAARCGMTNTQTNIQFWAQTNSGIGPDIDPGPLATMALVGYVPLTPTNVTAVGGNEALVVSWNWGAINIAADAAIAGVQLFCQRDTDTQVFSRGTFAPAYTTAASLCPTKATTQSTGSPFSDLDPRYLCSGLLPASSTSHRITGLQNGSQYGVGVAAVDKYGNIGFISDVVYNSPSAAADGSDNATFSSGCSFAVRARHGRSEAAVSLWLAVMALAFMRCRRGHAATGEPIASERAAQPAVL